MFDLNRSGQFVYFSMVSTASGLPITGIASGNISGRVAIDGGAIGVCGGPVIEDGGGMYHLNGFAADFNGKNLGFLFTASGAAVVTFTATTIGGISGKLSVIVNSGQLVNVFSGQLSGQKVDTLVNGDKTGYTLLSGTTWLTSGHPAVLYSGQIVQVYSGNLSGQFVNAFSGAVPTILSGTTFIASGPFVVASVTIASGTTFLASGQAVSLNSGEFVNVFSGQLSGQPISLLSGRSFIASGSPVAILDKSGYSLSSGGIGDLTRILLQRDVSGLESASAKQSLLGVTLKLTAGFNATSGITTQADGTTIFMTQIPSYGSGMQPIRALGVGA